MPFQPVFFFLWNTKEDILKNVSKAKHIVHTGRYKSWVPKHHLNLTWINIWKHFFKLEKKRKKVTQVWTEMRVSNLQLHLRWT